MMTDEQQLEVTEAEQAAIATVAGRAFEFGVASASPLGDEALEDPVLHTYFLLFVFGAIEWLGDNMDTGAPLPYPHKLAAMAEALSQFGTTDRETVRGTVLMLHNAADEAALRIRAAGGDAIRRWHVDGDESATAVFDELRNDPDALPREVQAVQPGSTHTTH
jgi:hypothetical protein